MSSDLFHPAVADWFGATFAAPTPAQEQAWPAIASGRNTLIAAPTGSGKTLAAFLAAIDTLIREGIDGALPDETAVVYVSPLKALSNDVRVNLEAPLAGIRDVLRRRGLPDVEIRTFVRTGDTPQAERNRMRKRPPHIVVTTPESLYILLGSESGRRMLGTTRTVIVDEIHALASNKRGAHLALSLERLDALCERRLLRIGLSATQKPIDEVAKFLVGTSARSDEARRLDCKIVDAGHVRPRDLAIELPETPLEAVMSGDTWQQVYARLEALVDEHRTTLIFVNTRRMAERAARHLSERIGKQYVTAHHGSLSKEHRFDAEQRLKRGELRALVATASLELGIDIGDVDLVCQIGSPRAIATFLQRVGRSGHAIDATPKGRLFPQSRDELVECAALLDAVRRGELDTLHVERAPLDVLAQQIVAEVACREWREDDLFDLVRRAYPFAAITHEQFTQVVRMLADGFTTRRGPRGAYLHRDAVNGVLRASRGARLTAITSGGAIPDTADYEVTLEPQAIRVGSVNEDFAVESIAGDIFQLGNQSYRILRVERGRVRVEDAQGAPPTIPFWLGEAPGRSDELSFAVSRLRETISLLLPDLTGAASLPMQPSLPNTCAKVDELTGSPVFSSPAKRGKMPNAERGAPDPAIAWERCPLQPSGQLPALRGESESTICSPSTVIPELPPTLIPGNRTAEDTGLAARAWLIGEVGIPEAAARQIVAYLAAAKTALGVLPTMRELAMERFFDESGGTQLVVHSPLGSRINRAWGLALRKRFCRKFNFELQAAATEDAIVLSLSTSHSFPLDDVARYLHSTSVRDVLIQALLDAPMFGVRWRWNATCALALPRFAGGAKVAPQLQRMKAEDLLATVFPDQVACAENLVGEREIPDHPLVAQTLRDCLHGAMDIDGLIALLRGLEAGDVRIIARDLAGPSPLAAEVLGARPYAYLDDAPLEERRTQAVASRGLREGYGVDDLGRLDPDAIEAVCAEAWPEARSADELHAALLGIAFMTEAEACAMNGALEWLQKLAADRRVTRTAGSANNPRLWIPAERLAQFDAALAGIAYEPPITAPADYAQIDWSGEEALVEIVRARLSALGPTCVSVLTMSLGLPQAEIEGALLKLEAEGYVMRGHFSAASATAEIQWCERHLLARIHRYTLKRLRREIEPVDARDFMRFLIDWQHLAPAARVTGPDALASVLGQLEGFEAAAAAWEAEILPARIDGYEIGWLDALSQSGRIVWTRLRGARLAGSHRGRGPIRSTPIVLLQRRHLAAWIEYGGFATDAKLRLSSRAQVLADTLAERGASFFDELLPATRLLRSELEDALGELVAAGWINSDGYSGLRALLIPASKRFSANRRHGRSRALLGIEDAGRWSLVRRAEASSEHRSPPISASRDRGSSTRTPAKPDADALEHVARVLLKRYGVVCWRMLAHEAPWLPPWRELLRVYHRLEARGEIRGGRFIAGLSGEQFALPEAIAALRLVRKRAPGNEFVCVCGVDPLNLVGSVLAGEAIPRVVGSRLLYRDGVVVAKRVAGRTTFLVPMDAATEYAARMHLLRGQAVRPLNAIPASA